ncbi:MAG TPA: hypothetical protein VER55_02885, partial [Ardenticatenaceae bacterium]|nr:hypothetical protein [Ardenticatenaceae bacterium]
TWSGTTPGPDPVPLTVEFRADETYVATQTPDGGEPETAEGRFTVLAPNQLRLETFESDLPPTIEDLSITLDGDTLTLRDQEGVDMILTRVAP